MNLPLHFIESINSTSVLITQIIVNNLVLKTNYAYLAVARYFNFNNLPLQKMQENNKKSLIRLCLFPYHYKCK